MAPSKAQIRPLSRGNGVHDVGFADLLVEKKEFKNHFIRYQSNGRLPSLEPVRKEPEIPPEEIQRRRLEQLERETYQRAYAAGERAGLAMGEQKVNVVLKDLDAVLRAIDQLPRQIMASAERYLVESALILVRQLLKHELDTNKEGIRERVRGVLAEAVGREAMALHLSPGDAETVSRLGEFSHLRIEPDESISPGSVRLESDFGGIEDNLGQQLEAMEQAIQAHLHARLEEIAKQPLPDRPPPDLAPEPDPAPEPHLHGAEFYTPPLLTEPDADPYAHLENPLREEPQARQPEPRPRSTATGQEAPQRRAAPAPTPRPAGGTAGGGGGHGGTPTDSKRPEEPRTILRKDEAAQSVKFNPFATDLSGG